MRVTRSLIALFLGIGCSWAWAALPIQHWQSDSGAQVYFIESHDLPILDIRVDFSAGSSMDTPQRAGLASMTLHMLDLGADGLSEDQIASSLADVGAQMSGHFDRDRAGISLRTLSSDRERAQSLGILARVMQRPVFPESVLEREKIRVISGVKEAGTKPEYIASRTLTKMLYGNHPYALSGSGEIATIEKLQRKDIEEFYRARYKAKGAVISLMGDVSRAEAIVIAENLTKDLPGNTDATSDSSLPTVSEPVAETRRIPHPATQSHITLAHLGLTRSDPDYYPLLVGNYILGGGGFASRLMEEIRQKRGLAYSVHSSLLPFRQAGPFEISLQTKKERSEEALSLTRKVLADFIAGGPTVKELIAAKRNIINGFPLRIDSNQKIIEYIALIGFYQLPLTYLEDYLAAVEKVTAAQIREAYQRRIKPEGMVTVIVGAAETKAGDNTGSK